MCVPFETFPILFGFLCVNTKSTFCIVMTLQLVSFAIIEEDAILGIFVFLKGCFDASVFVEFNSLLMTDDSVQKMLRNKVF
jgi:hypothetical protein